MYNLHVRYSLNIVYSPTVNLIRIAAKPLNGQNNLHHLCAGGVLQFLLFPPLLKAAVTFISAGGLISKLIQTIFIQKGHYGGFACGGLI